MNRDSNLNVGEFVAHCILSKDRAIQIGENEINFVLNVNDDSPGEFTKDLAGLISLVEVLKKDELLFIHSNPEILQKRSKEVLLDHPKSLCLTNDDHIQEKIDNALPGNYRTWTLPTTLAGYIPEYVNQFCYVRPELIEYIDNGFYTPEQLRFKKTLFWTRAAAIVSFIGLLIALFGVFYS